MTSSFPPDDDSLDSPLSGEAVTPRGGFMARPGLKSPPRHAVVVRGGDAPQSEHIPLLRSSIPPPPPAPEPELPVASEKITLRAIPTPVSSRAATKVAATQAASSAPSVVEPSVFESVPPPSHAPLSDAPFVSSVSDAPSGPESQRVVGRSRWTIVAAAAAGLLLGLASVAARLHAFGPAAQPAPAATLSVVAAASSSVTPASKPAPVLAHTASTPAATPDDDVLPSDRKVAPARTAPPSAKRSIF